MCPRVAACARARASLCGEAARQCLRVPGACARGCLAPCLCRCLGVSGEGACARRAPAPAPGGAVSGAGTPRSRAGGLFFSGRQRRGGWGGVCLGVWRAVAVDSIFHPRYPVKPGKLLGFIHPDSGFEGQRSHSPRCSPSRGWGFNCHLSICLGRESVPEEPGQRRVCAPAVAKKWPHRRTAPRQHTALTHTPGPNLPASVSTQPGPCRPLTVPSSRSAPPSRTSPPPPPARTHSQGS